MKKIIDDLKKFDWQFIIDQGNSLDDLNDSQWRFIKGLYLELTVADQDTTLEYVGEKHRDCIWHKHKLDVELKTQFSTSMYTKKEGLRKNFSIKLNNSNGTNKKATLSPSEVCDIIVVIRNDGAFLVDKDTCLKYAKSNGDGFELNVSSNLVTELSGVISKKIKYPSTLQDSFMKLMKDKIERDKNVSKN